MSFDISINKTRDITYSELLSNLKSSTVNIRFYKETSLDSNLSGYSIFYYNKASTRGVTINALDEEFDIIINAVASAADYELAIDLSEKLALLSDSKILPESEEKFLEISEFIEMYDTNWVDSIVSSSTQMFKTLIEANDDTITIPCCVRSFYFGKDIINEIESSTKDINEFHNVLCEKIRRVQFIEDENVRVPMLAEFKNSKGTLMIFNSDKNQMLVKSDFVYLSLNYVYKIPYEEFIKTTTLKLERLDEHQYLAKNISINTVERLADEFAKYRELQETKVKKKKWWKVW